MSELFIFIYLLFVFLKLCHNHQFHEIIFLKSIGIFLFFVISVLLLVIGIRKRVMVVDSRKEWQQDTNHNVDIRPNVRGKLTVSLRIGSSKA